MMTYAQYLEGNRQAMAEALKDTGRGDTGDHGPILLLCMHRVGRVAHALSLWSAIRCHGKDGQHAHMVADLRKQVLDFAAHATVLLEAIAARVEADDHPGRDDTDDLCMVVASAYKCTNAGDCPACEARSIIMHNAGVERARKAAAEEPGRDLN